MTAPRPTISRRRFIADASSLAAGSVLGAGLGLGSGCATGAGARLSPEFPQACPSGCHFPIVDVHCHTFNGSDLNVSGFISHVLPLPSSLTGAPARAFHRAMDGLAPSGADELKTLQAATRILRPAPGKAPAQLQRLVDALAGLVDFSDDHDSAARIAAALQLATRSRSQVAATLVQDYPQVELFTPAMVDYTHWSDDVPETPLADQLRVHARISQLARQGLIGRPGARIHPIAPFNPLREVREAIEPSARPYAPFGTPFSAGQRYACDAPLASGALTAPGSLSPLRHAVEQLGFVGAKVYPPVGFLPIGNADAIHDRDGLGAPLDLALHAFYAYCEAEEVPVMTHANASNGYAAGFGILADPDGWGRVLRLYPNLRLNLGHFGHLTGDDPEVGLQACELWMRKAAVLMESYPNVYADMGFSPANIRQQDRERYVELFEQLFATYPRAARRLMYGSDFWLNRMDVNHQVALDGLYALFDDFEPQRAGFMGRNALRFLGLIDDDDRPAATRNRARLRTLYGGEPLPRWLA